MQPEAPKLPLEELEVEAAMLADLHMSAQLYELELAHTHPTVLEREVAETRLNRLRELEASLRPMQGSKAAFREEDMSLINEAHGLIERLKQEDPGQYRQLTVFIKDI